MNEVHLSPPPSGAAWAPLPDELLRGVRGETGLDLFAYRRSVLARRVGMRMRQIGLADTDAYAAYCASTPGEYAALAEMISIPFTSFFRDHWVWETLQREVIPRLVARGPVRVWVAGCASGEEAYTLAMLLAEAVGRDRLAGRVHILATDISAPALERARRGVYPDARILDVPPRLRDAYLVRTPEGWSVCPALRNAVRFERHDLTHDPLPCRLDLTSCRNTLMYFEPSFQRRLLATLARGLRPGGCLLLGRAEGVDPDVLTLAPLNRKLRLFTPRPEGGRSPGRSSEHGGKEATPGRAPDVPDVPRCPQTWECHPDFGAAYG